MTAGSEPQSLLSADREWDTIRRSALVNPVADTRPGLERGLDGRESRVPARRGMRPPGEDAGRRRWSLSIQRPVGAAPLVLSRCKPGSPEMTRQSGSFSAAAATSASAAAAVDVTRRPERRVNSMIRPPPSGDVMTSTTGGAGGGAGEAWAQARASSE